jgi:major type 1 subunit fimbrin (pilin)
MKKTLFTAALIAAFGVAVASTAAAASDGTITIKGQITGASCTVTINGQGANPTVTLPTVQSNQFTAAGTASGFTAVTIALSGCTAGTGTPAVTKVLPFFEQGPNVDLTSGFLKNTGTATGVEVMLSNTNATSGALTLGGASGAQNAGTAVALTGNPSFTYYAAYVSTAAAVTAGTVSTSVQYDLNYQ